MAIRQVLVEGDPLLRKKSREITVFDQRLAELATDLIDTMYESNGIGLAAPQVGALRRVFVMDLREEGEEPLVVVNPIIECGTEFEIGEEGCLSIPGQHGMVERPTKVVLRAQDITGEYFTLEATGLRAVCICHENDHLDGILYRDRAIGELEDNE